MSGLLAVRVHQVISWANTSLKVNATNMSLAEDDPRPLQRGRQAVGGGGHSDVDVNRDVRAGRNYSEARHKGEVLYHDVPLVRRNQYRDLASDLEGPWTSRPYNFPIELVGAAGGWSMTAVDVARFLRGLTLRPGIEPIISADDLTALSQTLAPPFEQQGLAWVVATVPWEDAVTGSGSRAVLWHNGGLHGATSLAFHLFDRNNPADTISMVVLRNLAPGPLYVDPDGLALLRVAQEIELEGGWPAGDLFHAV